MIVIGKLTEVCPAGTVTLAGTVAALVTDDVRFTVTFEAAAPGSVTVPPLATTPSPSRFGETTVRPRFPALVTAKAAEFEDTPAPASVAFRNTLLPGSRTVTFPAQTPPVNVPVAAGLIVNGMMFPNRTFVSTVVVLPNGNVPLQVVGTPKVLEVVL